MNNTMNFKNNSINTKKAEIRKILLSTNEDNPMSPHRITEDFSKNTECFVGSLILNNGELNVHFIDYPNDVRYSTTLTEVEHGFYAYQGAKIKQLMTNR